MFSPNAKSQPKESVYESRGVGLSNMTYGQARDMGLVFGSGVNERNALGLSAVWCAVRVISEAIGSLPLNLYATDSPQRERERDNPLAALLSDPCPYLTRPVFFELLQSHALLWGTCYAEVVRGDDGVSPAYLLPIHPQCVSVSQAADYELTYTIDFTDGGRRVVRSEDMVSVPGLSPDGSAGYRLVELARECLGFGLAAQKHGVSLFRNLARPSGALEYPQQLTAEARDNIRQSWQTLHAGEGTGTVALLEEGLKFSPFVYASNEQAQYVELLTYFVYEVARLFNIPPTKLHSIQSATYSGNLESLNSSFVSETLGPWVGKWEAELAKKLVLPSQRGLWTVELNTDSLTRPDEATRFSNYATALNNGWLSVNEVREREGLGPVEGGDVYRFPLNMGQQTPVGQPTTLKTEVENKSNEN